MRGFWTILGKIVFGFMFLSGLYFGGAISLEIAITIGLLAVMFLFCFEELKKGLDPIKNAMAEIQKWLSDNFGFVPLHEIKPTGFVEEKSPLSLTPLGERVLEQSGAKQIIENNYIELEAIINENNLTTAYDVQVSVSKLIAKSEHLLTSIKSFTYNNPTFEGRPLKLVDIQRTMVVYLRDLYLKKHPQILK